MNPLVAALEVGRIIPNPPHLTPTVPNRRVKDNTPHRRFRAKV